MKACFQIAECSLSYAKIMQTSAMESLLSDCRVQLILCKDKAFLLYMQELDKEKENLVEERSCFSIFYHWKGTQHIITFNPLGFEGVKSYISRIFIVIFIIPSLHIPIRRHRQPP